MPSACTVTTEDLDYAPLKNKVPPEALTTFFGVLAGRGMDNAERDRIDLQKRERGQLRR